MKTKYILIAGHYDLLDQPTPFALNSMKSVIDIQMLLKCNNDRYHVNLKKVEPFKEETLVLIINEI